MNLKENIRTIIIAIGVVLIWRGIWGLSDDYLFHSNPTLSYAVSVIAGLLILLLIGKKKNSIDELL